MNDILKIFSSTAAAASLLSVLASLVSYLYSKYQQGLILEMLKEKNFETLLETSNIKDLGTYLDTEIGQLTISDYVDNKDINKRIDILINKLTQFVGTEEQINKETEENKESEKLTKESSQTLKDFPYEGKLGDEFDKIINELNYGEPWNALARLRRYIEIELRNLAKKNNLSIDKISNMTQLILYLKQNGIINTDISRNLEYTIHVSNRAVHGQNLSKGLAQVAIYHAAIALYKIRNLNE
ncbi:MAG TPA: hypothetical protein VK205_08950 [Prolixibacteraceae bacterium]|nr:hypothetical protein [Prolixibacteraceae bacterium]